MWGAPGWRVILAAGSDVLATRQSVFLDASASHMNDFLGLKRVKCVIAIVFQGHGTEALSHYHQGEKTTAGKAHNSTKALPNGCA